jgi:hypothetical protein
MAEKVLVGKVVHFYPKPSVAVVDVLETLKVGDRISIEKENAAFEQTVDSMQIEHQNIPEAKKGQSIGLKVAEKPKEGAQVFRVIE